MVRVSHHVRAGIVAMVLLALSAQSVFGLEAISGSVTMPKGFPDDCLLTSSLTGLDTSQTYRVDVIGIDATAGEYIASQPNLSSLSSTSYTDYAYRPKSVWGKGGSRGIVAWRFDLWRTSGTPFRVGSASVRQSCTYRAPKTR